MFFLTENQSCLVIDILKKSPIYFGITAVASGDNKTWWQWHVSIVIEMQNVIVENIIFYKVMSIKKKTTLMGGLHFIYD